MADDRVHGTALTDTLVNVFGVKVNGSVSPGSRVVLTGATCSRELQP